jgi:DNA invertase Pin-like site-specific DNA recombinase
MSSFLDSIRSAGTATIPGASTAECAFAYIRVSHERSAEKNISPETQRRRIEAYAREHGYTILGWYTDSAKSAFRDEDRRTEFLRMLSEAKRNIDSTYGRNTLVISNLTGRQQTS